VFAGHFLRRDSGSEGHSFSVRSNANLGDLPNYRVACCLEGNWGHLDVERP